MNESQRLHSVVSGLSAIIRLMPDRANQQLPAHLYLPHPDRLDPSRDDYAMLLQRHEAAIARGESFYVDPATGAMVFTAQSLWERGYCCDSGCRHCPYLVRP